MSVVQTQDISKYMRDNLFQGNESTIKIIQEYIPYDFLIHLADGIIRNDYETSNEVAIYILKNIEGIPDLATCKLRNFTETIKICMFIKTHFQLFEGRERVFGYYDIGQLSHYCLINIQKLHPVNEVDPITLEEIEAGDLFTAFSGQNFSINALVEYHNTRSYRGTNGEQYGQKFLLNPLNNSTFSTRDTESFIYKVAFEHPDKELIHLHSSAWGPPGEHQTDSHIVTENSPREYYDYCKEWR